MSSIEVHTELPHDPETGSDWVEQRLERTGEFLNPILVKEARQALKSRQFSITFSLLLLFGWSWSLLGLAWLNPEIYFVPAGRYMLIGYFIVLAIPLLIIVPFTAFRSLATEREDGTFELLSITTLTSRQIVTGKLGSALLQMLVYYSALSPCVAFTYLLRGIDLATIFLLLFYTFLVSLLLSCVGLLLATVTGIRHWQVFLSVVFLGALFFVGFVWSMSMLSGFLWATIPVAESEFWVSNGIGLANYAAMIALLITAASSQLSFASDNRSTRIRVVMLIQHFIFCASTVYVWLLVEEEFVFYIAMMIALGYWAFMTALMNGEWAELSPRVLRSLPQSFLGRACRTWLNPGSGTGYMFGVINMFSFVVLYFACFLGADAFGFAGAAEEAYWALFAPLMFCFFVSYLGFSRLIVQLGKMILPIGVTLSLIITVIFLTFGSLIPFVIPAALNEFREIEYSAMQFTNWIWTFTVIVDEDMTQYPISIALISLSAIVIFLINFLLTIRDVERVRLATPLRVLEDEKELHPERYAMPRKSPWDDPNTGNPKSND